MAVTITQATVPLSPSTVSLGYVPPGGQIIMTPTASSTLLPPTQVYGTASAPAAGATVTTMPLAAGAWKFVVGTHVWGTGVGTPENNNMALSGVPGGPFTLIVDGGSGTTPMQQDFSFWSGTASTILVTAVGAGSANSVYSVMLTASPVTSDIYIGTSANLTPANGMPLTQQTSIVNPAAALGVTYYATAQRRTHTLSVLIATSR